ncbi:hypothetical protein N3K66_008875 [Trichothecium roseum]|uniref:Uncharacterized protein n=1 Tax=Trichothecium roseum TaxID=47278 RepID=A0ACC0URE5_9HYPO|nr:hypothetical protein N3K66_008875 [Trichothecium roseum]
MCFQVSVHYVSPGCEDRKVSALGAKHAETLDFDVSDPFHEPEACRHAGRSQHTVNGCPQHGTICCRNITGYWCVKGLDQGFCKCLGNLPVHYQLPLRNGTESHRFPRQLAQFMDYSVVNGNIEKEEEEAENKLTPAEQERAKFLLSAYFRAGRAYKQYVVEVKGPNPPHPGSSAFYQPEIRALRPEARRSVVNLNTAWKVWFDFARTHIRLGRGPEATTAAIDMPWLAAWRYLPAQGQRFPADESEAPWQMVRTNDPNLMNVTGFLQHPTGPIAVDIMVKFAFPDGQDPSDADDNSNNSGSTSTSSSTSSSNGGGNDEAEENNRAIRGTSISRSAPPPPTQTQPQNNQQQQQPQRQPRRGARRSFPTLAASIALANQQRNQQQQQQQEEEEEAPTNSNPYSQSFMGAEDYSNRIAPAIEELQQQQQQPERQPLASLSPTDPRFGQQQSSSDEGYDEEYDEEYEQESDQEERQSPPASKRQRSPDDSEDNEDGQSSRPIKRQRTTESSQTDILPHQPSFRDTPEISEDLSGRNAAYTISSSFLGQSNIRQQSTENNTEDVEAALSTPAPPPPSASLVPATTQPLANPLIITRPVDGSVRRYTTAFSTNRHHSWIIVEGVLRALYQHPPPTPETLSAPSDMMTYREFVFRVYNTARTMINGGDDGTGDHDWHLRVQVVRAWAHLETEFDSETRLIWENLGQDDNAFYPYSRSMAMVNRLVRLHLNIRSSSERSESSEGSTRTYYVHPRE